MEFAGGIAVVTGGGSGIGEALSLALANEGMRVAVVDVNADRAVAVADRIGSAAHAYQADVTRRDALCETAAQVLRDFGGLNLLCANAGVVMPFGSVLGRDDSDWQYVISVNLFGVVHTVDAFVPLLRQSAGNAHILVTSSMGGMQLGGHIPLGPYTVSKYACVGYCEELRAAVTDEHIGVSMLTPGVVTTEIMHNSTETRPPELGMQAPPPRDRGYVSPRLAAMAVSAEQAANAALRGIREDLFYIPTHVDAADKLQAHFDRIVAQMSGQGYEAGADA